MNHKLDQPVAEPLLSRPYQADEIPAKGVSGSFEASEKERSAIAAALDLVGLESLRMEFQLRRSGPRHFILKGHMAASAIQTCVVSLARLETKIDTEIEIECWPPEEVARIETKAESKDTSIPLEGPEPITDGMIDVGQLAYEHLAASLDLYPKAPGIQFDWNDPKVREDNASAYKPFASLAELKGRE